MFSQKKYYLACVFACVFFFQEASAQFILNKGGQNWTIDDNAGTLEVQDTVSGNGFYVDKETGNINFDGSVQIDGDMLTIIGTNDPSADIGSPSEGNVAYATGVNTLQYYNGTDWISLTGADNLGDHTATQNIELGAYYLSGDGGDEGVFVASDGDVGIGTNIPQSIFNVASGRITVGSSDIGNVTNGVSIYGVANDNAYGYQAGQTATNNITFGWVSKTTAGDAYGYIESYAGNNDLRIMRTGSGNVGIGIPDGTDIESKLNVNGDVLVTNTNDICIDGVSAGIDGDETCLSDTGDNLGDHTATQNIELGSYYLSGDGDNEGIFIDGDGDIGIGTNNPQESFHVYGPGNQRMLIESSDAGSAQFRLKNNNTVWHFEAFNNSFQFVETDVAARITINEGGNTGIGKETPNEKLEVAGNILATNGNDICIDGASEGINGDETCLSDTGDDLGDHEATQNIDLNTFKLVGNNGTLGIAIDASGNVTADGIVTSSSDITLKTNIEPLTGSLDKVLEIQGVRYEWKPETGRQSGAQIGVIAQEVQAVYPELVGSNEDGLTVNYAGLVAPMIEAIRELRIENEALKQRLDAAGL